MRNSIILFAAGLTIAGAASANETRELKPFDQIETSRGVEVTLVCGGSPKAVLQGSAEDIADLEVMVEGHALIVRRASMWGNNHRHARIEVTAAQPLEKLEASSGSEVRAQACAFSTDHVDLSGSSGAEVRLAANTGRLTIDADSGASFAPISGGRIDAKDAKISVTSGASVKVCAVGHLSGRASTGGNITTENDPSGDFHANTGGNISTRSCM